MPQDPVTSCFHKLMMVTNLCGCHEAECCGQELDAEDGDEEGGGCGDPGACEQPVEGGQEEQGGEGGGHRQEQGGHRGWVGVG